MSLLESGEMYLETILVLSEKKSLVRAIDISEYRGFSKPSVSRAMGLLKNGGYIKVDPNGGITLTDAGREIAERIYDRHTTFTNILVALGVEPSLAADDACELEHHISDESFNAIKNYAKKHGI